MVSCNIIVLCIVRIVRNMSIILIKINQNLFTHEINFM